MGTARNAEVTPVAVLAGEPAAAAAVRLGVPVAEAPLPDGVTLRHRAGCWEALLPGTGPVRAGASLRRLAAGRHSPLARAVGLDRRRGVTVLDATAGLGRDAFQLAWWGGKVTALERDPVLVFLLESALAGAPARVRANLTVCRADARAVLAGLEEEERPQVVYLDPVWPQGRRAARARKETELVRRLAGVTAEAAELFTLARQAARERVVVKRPRRVPPLAGEPDRTVRGTKVLYDVYRCR